MSTNPYKSFIPFIINFAKGPDDMSEIACVASDPSGGQWSACGIVQPFKGEEPYVIDLQGAGRLMVVQFNERILPGKVRDEVLTKKVEKLQSEIGRSVSKKEYAQLRDEVEFDLLPKAFIRRSRVPVLFTKLGRDDRAMLICTSSQRRADECLGVLTAFFGDKWQATRLQCTNDGRRVLSDLAAGGRFRLEESNFDSGMNAVLKGEEKRTIRIKDKDVADADVQQFLAEGYTAAELGVTYCYDPIDDESVTCTITEQLVFKGVTLPGVKINETKGDRFGTAVLIVQTYKRMLEDFVVMSGGMVKAEEDDEL